VNTELKVGALEESVTVTGETPVVDVQSAKTQQVLSADVIGTIPTARNYQNLHVLVPGVTVASGSQDVGGTGGDQQVFFSAHGGEVRDSRTQVNGLMIGAPQVGGGRTMFVPSVGAAQETSVTTSGGLGEAETAGVVVNIISKDGGNVYRGSLFATGATEGMSASNFSQELKDQGLRAPNTNKNVYDYEGTFGGPIRKDKLWFFGDMRYHGNTNYIAGMFVNKNAGNLKAWTYDPDLSQQATQDSFWLAESLRLTWQITPRNKFAVSYEDQLRCVTCTAGGSATQSPEAASKGASHPVNLGQTNWSSPVTGRILLEAGFSVHTNRYGAEAFDVSANPALIPVSAQNGSIPGLTYRGPTSNQNEKNWLATYGSRASATYTPGAHSMKFGYNGTFYIQNSAADINGADKLTYRFTTPDPGGVPNQFTQFAYPFDYWTHANQWGLYAQDLWTVNRLTLAGGLRYDRFTTEYPESHVGPSRFVPTQQVFAAYDGAKLNDISPRVSAAYDLFGNGKTAVKASFGKYLVAQDSNGSLIGPGAGAIVARLASSVARSWTDSNGNFVVDCDLTSQLAQSLASSGGDVCGAGNAGFGKPNTTTSFDPAIYRGWGVRPFNYAFDLSLQRELMPRLSVNVAYFRRWFGNFLLTQNRALGPADYTTFNLPIPNDPRLPVSDGFVTVQNVIPTKFSVPADNYVTASDNFGKQIQHWNGMDFGLNARLRSVLLQGGVSTGRQSTDNCEIAAKIPNVLNTGSLITPAASPGAANAPTQYCHLTEPWQTQVKLLGSYTIPRIAVQVAGTLQNIPGQVIAANYAVPNSVVQPLLGRPLSGSAATTTVNLLSPSTFYADRVNQVDLRFAKILRFGGRRLQASADLFNALNTSVPETYNNAYSPTGSWQVPTAILSGRLLKLSAQFDF